MNNLKIALAGMAILSLGACRAEGNVKLEYPAAQAPQTVVVSYSRLNDLLNARRNQQVESISDTLTLPTSGTTFEIKTAEWAEYHLDFGQGREAEFLAAPGDNLTLTVTDFNPATFDYSVSGSEMVREVEILDSQLNPIVAEFNMYRQTPGTDPAVGEALIDKYNALAAKYVRQNPGSIAAPYALLNYDGDEYEELFGLLTEQAIKSPFYAKAEQKAEKIKAAMEKKKLQNELQSGNVVAPDFTLRNLEGKEVSLSSLRGKFVVIDFWGSWCIWCIKGFPALKEAYADGKGGFEVLGVDCQDSDEKWRAAVAKYELPWINVYNPENSGILDKYGVSGFPTKVIVNPEGKIVNITVGEDPSFFDTLRKLMGK